MNVIYKDVYCARISFLYEFYRFGFQYVSLINFHHREKEHNRKEKQSIFYIKSVLFCLACFISKINTVKCLRSEVLGELGTSDLDFLRISICGLYIKTIHPFNFLVKKFIIDFCFNSLNIAFSIISRTLRKNFIVSSFKQSLSSE